MGWTPLLNPGAQTEIFHCPARHILGYGEKGSGKTGGFLQKMVRHCYENSGALALVITPTLRVGREGVVCDLEDWALPQWRDGIGLKYSEVTQDPQTKDRSIKVGAMNGGTSKILQMSIQYPRQVESRVKAMSPSFVLMDELTQCRSRNYFEFIAAQVGRRRNIKGPQQYCAACNPEGPSHWVYKVFFEECVDPETGVRDPRYKVFHVPIKENAHNLPPGYIDNLNSIFRDPITRRRLMNGEWVDRPSGEAIFRGFFNQDIHVRGDPVVGTGITPIPGFPCTIGYDTGPKNFCATFMQMLPIKDESLWVAFDEINYVGQYRNYKLIAPEVVERMEFWSKVVGAPLTWEHIADRSAMTVIDKHGSTDALDLERLSRGRIRFKSPTKYANSVTVRVRLVMSALESERLLISARCVKLIDMFHQLVGKNSKSDEFDASAGMKPRRSIHLHPFDSLSYVIQYYNELPGMGRPRVGAIKPMVYTAGR
jgi:hypothetical protein